MGVFSLFNFMNLNLVSALEGEAPLFPGDKLFLTKALIPRQGIPG